MSIRLNKYLAGCGIASRRMCDQLIADGEVRVNGQVVSTLGTQITEGDEVTVGGVNVTFNQANLYVLLNKPAGYISSVIDDRGRKTVVDLVRTSARIFPIGRLDLDSEGLLLLTNDGLLAHRLMHPKFGVPKTYRVVLDRPIDGKHLGRIKKGITLEDGLTAPCRVRTRSGTRHEVEITIGEGRNRQVKRMFKTLGFRVLYLERIKYGPLTLDHLKRGEWRYLRKNEVNQLKKLVGIIRDSNRSWQKQQVSDREIPEKRKKSE